MKRVAIDYRRWNRVEISPSALYNTQENVFQIRK